jgi:hypothetical protein
LVQDLVTVEFMVVVVAEAEVVLVDVEDPVVVEREKLQVQAFNLVVLVQLTQVVVAAVFMEEVLVV